MKKIIFVLILVTIVATGTVFADASHPNKLGIGVLWRGGMNWGSSFGAGGAALALKIPSLPIYWGVNVGFGNNWFSIGLTGDNYFLGGALASNMLYWYLGIGGYLGFHSDNNNASIGLGARLPIGLSLQVLNRVLEIFAELAPSLGIGIWTHGQGGVSFPNGGLNVGIGIRVWI